MRRLLLALSAAAVLTGCGASEYEACVDHSLEEGVEQASAERACGEVFER